MTRVLKDSSLIDMRVEGNSVAEVSEDGLKLASGADVLDISDDGTMASASDNNIYTGRALQEYIGERMGRLIREQVVADPVSEIVFTNLPDIPMKLILNNFNAEGGGLIISFSTDNGATWLNGAGLYVSVDARMGGSYVYTANDSNESGSTLSPVSDPTNPMYVVVDLQNPESTYRFQFMSRTNFVRTITGNIQVLSSGGRGDENPVQEALVNAIRLTVFNSPINTGSTAMLYKA